MPMQRKTKIGLALATSVAALGGITGVSVANTGASAATVGLRFLNQDATPIQMCVSDTSGNAEQCVDVESTGANTQGGSILNYTTDQGEVLVKAKDGNGAGEATRVTLSGNAITCSNTGKTVRCG